MPKTRQEIEELKQGWLRDSCWDIETTEGFENHKDELLAFRREWEAEWERQAAALEAEKDAVADRIGARGLYRMVLNLSARIERLESCWDETLH